MVTGALGNVDGYVARNLIKSGQDVTVADINLNALNERYDNKATCVYFNFTDHSTFETALKDVDRVLLCIHHI